MAETTPVQAMIDALGGAQNIEEVEACMTRLRVSLKNNAAISKEKLLAAGALDVLEVNQVIHVILGTKAQQYRNEIQQSLAG